VSTSFSQNSSDVLWLHPIPPFPIPSKKNNRVIWHNFQDKQQTKLKFHKRLLTFTSDRPNIKINDLHIIVRIRKYPEGIKDKPSPHYPYLSSLNLVIQESLIHQGAVLDNI